MKIKGRKTEFILYTGKGGVGKTSVASATALWLSRKGKKTLLVSIDPAHSLSDSFERKVGSEETKLAENLYGIEIDPAKTMAEYKEKLMPQMEKLDFIKAMGLEDSFDIAGMTPGMDEIAAFDKFLRYMGSNEYDAVVFDTAPTGHALRFLSLPDVLDSWVGKLIRIRMQFAGIAGLVKKILPFGKDDTESIGTEQLDAMKERIARAKELLTDPGRTSFGLVVIPEEMSIFESLRSLETLKGYGIPVKSVIVNNIVPESKGCGFCMARRRMQLARLETIRKKFGGCRIYELPLFPEEVKGEKMLERVAGMLYGKRGAC